MSVSAVESGGEATVGTSCAIHLNVWKRFSLVAARVAEPCFPPGVWVGGGLGGRWLASNLRYWVWDGTANPYRSYFRPPSGMAGRRRANCLRADHTEPE